MMQKKNSVLLIVLVHLSLIAEATDWPLEIKTKEGGVINIYQPQPESLRGNRLEGRTAFSARAMAGDELTFGVFWFTATLATDRDTRIASLETLHHGSKQIAWHKPRHKWCKK